MKRKYKVYAQYYFETEDGEDDFTEFWNYMGETFAVSEKQAINNVRFRNYGNISQYKPITESGHWCNGFNWKAVIT